MSTVNNIEEFDCIVIGSGFGGSVMTHKLSRAGHSVLLLERGKPYPPGQFARTPLANSTNLWDPSERLYGLFDLWSFKRFEAVVSSGLGGGSLIYANVMMRKPAGWFDPEVWPVSAQQLDPHYADVEDALGVRTYPYGEHTSKTSEIRRAATNAQLNWRPAPLAVAFSPTHQPMGLPIAGVNRFGVGRTTCVRCGQCDVGCNTGSKNSMDLTYLSTPEVRHRAEVKTLHEVRRISRLENGRYEVAAVEHSLPEPEWERRGPGPKPTPRLFRAKCVVLAAGSLGSTFLLLRNQVNLPHLSKQLGRRFCGNADYLGFVRTGSQGILDASRGPVITGCVSPAETDLAAGNGTGPRLVVQDGGYPVLADWLSEIITPRAPKRVAAVVLAWALARFTSMSRTRISARFADVVGDSAASRGVVPLLGMGEDIADGVMSLRKGELDVTWNATSSDPAFGSIRHTMNDLAKSLGGVFSDSFSTQLSRMITVHPLGGVPMGRDVEHGVVDGNGEVFGYPGLFVADGSVMPGPVGVNPSLTIAALASLFAERVNTRCHQPN